MRLKLHVYPALMALALCVAVVVAWPAPAGSVRHARGAGQDLSERAPKKAAAAGTGTGWVAMCLFVAVAFLVARELRTKHTIRQEHQQWEMLAEEWRNGWHQGRPEATLPTPGPPRRIPSRNSGSRITTREKVQW
jgi:hypothetical protein